MTDYPLTAIEPQSVLRPPGRFVPRPHHALARRATLFAEEPVARPALELFGLPGGRLFNSYSDFLLLDHRGHVVRRSRHSPDLVAQYRAAGAPLRAGRVFVVRDMSSARNYCHWVCDWMPRILTLRSLFHGPMVLAMTENLTTYQRDFLAMVDQVEVLDCGGRAVEAEELIFLSTTLDFCHPANYGDPVHMMQLDALVDLAEQRSDDLAHNIFVPRIRSGRRTLDREARFIEMLARAGVRTIYPEDMTAAEQIRIFAAARNIVGIHGGGLVNLVFARQCRNVVEIFPPDYGTWTFQVLADAIGAKYHYWFEGDPGANMLNGETRDRGFSAPLDRLLDRTLAAIG